MNASIGIDTHGKGIHYQIESSCGTDLGRGTAAKSLDGWLDLMEVLKEANVEPEGTSVFIEATGRHHLPWCERFHAEGFKPYALNPLITKRLYSAGNAIRDNKNDRIDAATLGEVGRLYEPKLARFLYQPQAQKLGLQSLVSSRRTLRHQCTNIMKAAGDLLALVFPECKTLDLKLTSKGFRKLLIQFPAPRRLREVPLSLLRESVGDKAGKLQKAAADSITPDDVADACSAALVGLLESIEKFFEGIEGFDQKIEQVLAKSGDTKRERLLRSIPGFGNVTVPVLAAFLPDDFTEWVSRSEKGYKKKLTAKLQAHFGFDPRVRESGSYKGKVRLSKRGIEAARTALFQASVCSRRYDPEIEAYYQKKKTEGDHHTKAIVDIMRKNLRRMIAVLVDEKPFQPNVQNA